MNSSRWYCGFHQKNLLVAVAGKNIAEGRTDEIKILRQVIDIKRNQGTISC
jgi:hypothetical protein